MVIRYYFREERRFVGFYRKLESALFPAISSSAVNEVMQRLGQATRIGLKLETHRVAFSSLGFVFQTGTRNGHPAVASLTRLAQPFEPTLGQIPENAPSRVSA